MAGRSFEKLVREEMEGLRIKPEEGVWQHLEAALEQKKKKRWVFWLFFAGMGCLCLSTTWYFLARTDLSSTPKPEISVPSNTLQTKPGKTELEMAVPADVPIQVLKGLQAGNVAGEKETGSGQKRPTAVPGKEMHIAGIQASENPQREDREKTEENKAVQDIPSLAIDKQQENGMSAILPSTILPKDSSFTDPHAADTTRTINGQEGDNTDAQKPVGKSVTSRWQLSLAISGGRSGMRTGIGKMPEYPVVLSANIPAFPGAAGSWRTPSLLDAGSFGLNAEFSKPLRKHAGMSLLVGYQLYRTQTGVGRKIDSSVQATAAGPRSGNGAYYLSTDSAAYLNHFHFLQAGISGYLQYPISAKMQVRWNVGAAAAVLLKSNALHYDATAGILYTDNALLNRFQWNFFSSIELGLGKDPLVYIGPEWSWFVTTPYQSTVNGNQHLFRSVLKARVVLGRNNKR